MHTAQDEPTLIRRAQAGDREAFGELVLAHQRFVYNLALRAVDSPEEAEDLAQEAFLRAWQALPGFRGQAAFSTWLYRIVVNLCYNRQPRLKRELQALPLDADNDPGEAQRQSVEQWMDAGELSRMLHRQVDALPASYRILILLRYAQEYSYEEIAGVLSMPLGTVKTGLFRAKAALRLALEKSQEVLEWTR